MDFLAQKILEKDPTAIMLAKEWGVSASAVIKPLTQHEDAGVRQIAIRALNRSGSPGAARFFADALLDESPSVRAAALNALDNHLDEEIYPQLLNAYEKVIDSQHRQEIALLLGQVKEANINELKRVFENEQNPEALEGCLVALAKLGEPKSKVEFLNLLRNSKDRQLKRFLEYVEYIKQLWALSGLESVLNDKMPLVGIGICSMGTGIKNKLDEEPEFLRACDIAVNLISKIAGAKFPFPVGGAKNYADAELAAARQVLSSIFSQPR